MSGPFSTKAGASRSTSKREVEGQIFQEASPTLDPSRTSVDLDSLSQGDLGLVLSPSATAGSTHSIRRGAAWSEEKHSLHEEVANLNARLEREREERMLEVQEKERLLDQLRDTQKKLLDLKEQQTRLGSPHLVDRRAKEETRLRSENDALHARAQSQAERIATLERELSALTRARNSDSQAEAEYKKLLEEVEEVGERQRRRAEELARKERTVEQREKELAEREASLSMKQCSPPSADAAGLRTSFGEHFEKVWELNEDDLVDLEDAAWELSRAVRTAQRDRLRMGMIVLLERYTRDAASAAEDAATRARDTVETDMDDIKERLASLEMKMQESKKKSAATSTPTSASRLRGPGRSSTSSPGYSPAARFRKRAAEK